jgi:Pescadillo N-terminus
MGNRVKGREKKKGIKAAIGSNAGSKRKLSRMGKKQKKEHSGLEASFIGRSACIKMLQVSIKDFRRLCILKGIYPREPTGNRVPGKKKGQTFYHIKDIRAIAHEPILEKFREFRAFMKKVCFLVLPRMLWFVGTYITFLCVYCYSHFSHW